MLAKLTSSDNSSIWVNFNYVCTFRTMTNMLTEIGLPDKLLLVKETAEQILRMLESEEGVCEHLES